MFLAIVRREIFENAPHDVTETYAKYDRCIRVVSTL